jgi:predicted metal-dependent hydrolase
METITVRKMQFNFHNIDPIFIKGLPEVSHYNNGSSFVLPYLEGFIIRSMRKALPLIRDKKLRQDVEHFCRQEAQHSHQHHAFNRALKAYGYPELEAKELQVKKHFQRYNNRSLKFCLAYASGFESLATHAALATLQSGLLDHCHGEIGDMWKWHLFEELEHRNLAFDVYQHLYGGWGYRNALSAFSLIDVSLWFARIGNYLLREDQPMINAEYDGEVGRKQRMQLMANYNKRLFSSFMPTFKPGYNPRQVSIPMQIQAMTPAFNAAAC